jgi:hypothetical protein
MCHLKGSSALMLEIRLECERIGDGTNGFFDLHDHDLLLSDHKKTPAGYVPPEFSASLNQYDGIKGSSRPRAALGNADATKMILMFELFSSFTIVMHRLSAVRFSRVYYAIVLFALRQNA